MKLIEGKNNTLIVIKHIRAINLIKSQVDVNGKLIQAAIIQVMMGMINFNMDYETDEQAEETFNRIKYELEQYENETQIALPESTL